MIIEPKIKNYITAHLRKIFKWSSQYKACKTRAHIDGGLYICEGCNLVINKNGKDSRDTITISPAGCSHPIHDAETRKTWAEAMFVDHIDPVVPLTGWYGDDHYSQFIIKRMFPGNEGLQYLCQSCHYLKTQYENNLRRENKKKKETK